MKYRPPFRHTLMVACALVSAFTLTNCAEPIDVSTANIETPPPSGMAGMKGSGGAWATGGAMTGSTGGMTVAAGGSSAATGGSQGSTGGTGTGGSSAKGGASGSAGGAAGAKPGTGGTVAGTGGTVAGTGGTVAGTGGTVAGTGGSKPATGGSTGTGGAPPAPPPLSGSVASAAQACLNTPMPTTGTIHYACDCQSGADPSCKAGSDSNAGTDPSKPWQSYDKLQGAFNTMKAGDTVAFCRGGVWNGDTKNSWVNANCKASAPCTVRDYVPPGGASTLPVPKIVGASFNLLNNGNAAHEEGYQIMNLYMDGGPGYAITTGVQTGNDLSDVLVCNLTITNYNIGVYNGNSNPPGPGSDGKNYRITVRGSQIFGNQTMGYLGTCNDCSLEYNVFDHNGTADLADHDIYLQAAADGSGSDYYATGERIVGNEVYHSAQGTGSTCKGAPIVVHGLHDGLLIANNTVSQDLGTAEGSCWGISVTKGYAHTEGFKNVTISGNVVKNVGNASIQLAYCQNCIVENNLIIQAQSGFDSSAIVAHYNGDIDPQDLPMNAVQVLNNTIYMATASNNSSGIVVGLQGTGHVVANNVIVGSTTHMFSCLAYDLSASAYVSDYNYCWNLGGSVSAFEYASQTSLAAWQSKSGLDAHSKVVNPMLKAPALTSYDFSPATGSPLIGAAVAHVAPIDILGNTRPTPADIGAYQH